MRSILVALVVLALAGCRSETNAIKGFVFVEPLTVEVWNEATETLHNGSLVRLTRNTVEGLPGVECAQADSALRSRVVGMALEDIDPGCRGLVRYRGIVSGVDTTSYEVGQVLFLSPVLECGFVGIEPKEIAVRIGLVLEPGKVFLGVRDSELPASGEAGKP